MRLSQKIKEKALALGFELVGITPAQPVPDLAFFQDWLAKGYAGTMTYLNRGAERRGDPDKVLPGVQSLICCGLNYHTGHQAQEVASYAWGEDYHRVLGEKLSELESFIRSLDPQAQTKSYVDTGPVLERSYAAQAGLGWIGKNTCLINNGVGSYVFLGEILTTLSFDELEYDRPALDQCGTCSKCLDACPTGAFVEPYMMDATRCVSYLTIEYRGEFSTEQKAMVGDHLYGCDICQQVCPYNDRIPVTPLKEFQPQGSRLTQLTQEGLTEEVFQEAVKGSAMDRVKWAQWKRNKGIVGQDLNKSREKGN